MMGMGKALEARVRKVHNLADSSALNKVFCIKEQVTSHLQPETWH